MKFGFIGAGKVGFSLGKYLAVNNEEISGYYSKTKENAIMAAEFTNSKCYNDMKSLADESDVIFITVPDGEIQNVWKQLSLCHIKNKIVCHCSGAMSSKVFNDVADSENYGYSIHPLFAVNDKYKSYKELSKSFFTIEGSEEKINDIVGLFNRLGNPFCVIKGEDKVKYHAAAAIASNLVVGLLACSENLLMECGFDEKSAHEALKNLVTLNVRHVVEDGVVNALTGPVERNDVETVMKHKNVLKPQERDMYVSVSGQVLKIAEKKNPKRDYSEMEEILK